MSAEPLMDVPSVEMTRAVLNALKCCYWTDGQAATSSIAAIHEIQAAFKLASARKKSSDKHLIVT